MDAFDYNCTSVSLKVLGVPSLGGTKALWFHSCILCTLITQSELHCELWLNLHYVLCVSSSYQICDSRHILISEFYTSSIILEHHWVLSSHYLCHVGASLYSSFMLYTVFFVGASTHIFNIVFVLCWASFWIFSFYRSSGGESIDEEAEGAIQARYSPFVLWWTPLICIQCCCYSDNYIQQMYTVCCVNSFSTVCCGHFHSFSKILKSN